MPGQVIGTVNVQIGPTVNPRVNTLQYGGRTLKSATDLQLTGARNGDVIVYQSNTNSFLVEPVSALVPSLDQGFF
jgi:hypothetical protein